MNDSWIDDVMVGVNGRFLRELLEKVGRYDALMTKYIIGKCPHCNYMACWPVCTKCGTPYPPEGKDEN